VSALLRQYYREQVFVQNARGTVKIIDRKGLEASACECYAVIQKFDGIADTLANLG